MSRPLVLALGLMSFALPTAGLAEPAARLKMGFPLVLPPLVEVEPGVRVVQDFREEVFFVDGQYWTLRGGSWYRARDHRGSWRRVAAAQVPLPLTRQAPGRYLAWRHDELRVWPDVRHARRDARHWRTDDARLLSGPSTREAASR